MEVFVCVSGGICALGCVEEAGGVLGHLETALGRACGGLDGRWTPLCSLVLPASQCRWWDGRVQPCSRHVFRPAVGTTLCSSSLCV